MPCIKNAILQPRYEKHDYMRTHLLLTLLKAQARRELYEIPIDAGNDASDGRCPRNTTRPGMRNVDPDEDRRLLDEPSKRIASKPMVDPAQLRVHFKRHVRQILILLGLVERLFEQ